MIAVMIDYVAWWYSGGLKRLMEWLSAVYGWMANLFSVRTVLSTLFSPWKKLVGAKKPGIDGLKDWILDNLVSRGVGFVMRLGILFAYLVCSIIFLVFSIFFVVFWVGFPLFLVLSFMKVFI